ESAGDELHGTDGAVPLGVGVPAAAVSVADRGDRTAAVEHRTQDAVGLPVGVHPTAAGVPALDLADAGEHLPPHPAGRIILSGVLRRCLVGVQHHTGYTQTPPDPRYLDVLPGITGGPRRGWRGGRGRR